MDQRFGKLLFRVISSFLLVSILLSLFCLISYNKKQDRFYTIRLQCIDPEIDKSTGNKNSLTEDDAQKELERLFNESNGELH